MYPTLFRIPYPRLPDQHVRRDDGDRLPGRLLDHREAHGGGGPRSRSRHDAADLRDARRDLRLEALLRDRRLAARGGSLLAALLRARRHHLVRRADRRRRLVGAIGCRIHGLSVKTFADCTAVAGAVGQALGRIGCFLVGDDYGRPSSLPWAVAFPQGAPPTLATRAPDAAVRGRLAAAGGGAALVAPAQEPVPVRRVPGGQRPRSDRDRELAGESEGRPRSHRAAVDRARADRRSARRAGCTTSGAATPDAAPARLKPAGRR